MQDIKIIKRGINISLALMFSLGILNAQNINKDQIGHSKGNKYFEYDDAKGWWWYKEEVRDKNGTKKQIKIKVSPIEKLKIEQQNRLIELIAKQNKLIKKQNKTLEKIQARLDYAFPNLTPKYGVNSKGEKCIANSSADCFVFPLQPEALHVPVLANWLKNPSPENSTKWLQWQAKYFNHLDQIGFGLRFAFLNGGKKAYPTNANITYYDNPTHMIYNKVLEHREKQILSKIKDKIGVLIFLGKNFLFELNNNAYGAIWKLFKKNNFWNKNINYIIVLPNEEAKNQIKNVILKSPKYKGFTSIQKAWEKLFKEGKVIVSPKMFKKFNIYVTPSVVMTYKDEKDKKIKWSIIEVGTISLTSIRKGLINYLTYQGVINPADLTMSDNLSSSQKNLKDPTIKIGEKMKYGKQIPFIRMNEGEKK